MILGAKLNNTIAKPWISIKNCKATRCARRIYVLALYVFLTFYLFFIKKLTLLKAELQSSINSAERRLEDQQTLSSDLRTLQGDVEEKKTRVEKLKNDIRSADYDARLAEKTDKARSLEEERENLSGEIRKLSLQADSRAKLDLTRKEIKSKNTEIKTV